MVNNIEDMLHWLSNPIILPIVLAIFIIRFFYVIFRYISVSNLALSFRRQKIANIELLERTNVSLRDKDTALYSRIRLIDSNGRPIANRKVNMVFYKGNNRLSNSSYRGNTCSVSDRNGICEYCGIRVFEQGIINAVVEIDNAIAYMDGIDLTAIIIKRNRIPVLTTELFEKSPDRRLSFYSLKLDHILNKSMDIYTYKKAYKEKMSAYVKFNLINLLTIPILLLPLFNWMRIPTLAICLADLIIFAILISAAKKIYDEIRDNIVNTERTREDLHKDIIYLYNEIYYDLSVIVNDSEAFHEQSPDLQDKCGDLARHIGMDESLTLA